MLNVGRFGRKLLYGIFVLLIITAALEGGLRLYNLIMGTGLDEDLCTEIARNGSKDHPYLQYTSLKSFHGWLQHLEPGKRFWVETNSDGFRTREFLPKHDGTFRILLLGDSFVYGYNASQNETLAVKLEEGLRRNLHQDIEVLSLGVASYSGVRYAMLTKLYLDKLNPDMVIVAIDQSDLEEDVVRIDHYRLDREGYPMILKKAEELMSMEGHHRVFIDDKGALVIEECGVNRLLNLRLASALFDRAYRLAAAFGNWRLGLKADAIKSKDYGEETVRYEDLVLKYGKDLSVVLPKRMQADTIPYDLETALKRYEPTFRCLNYIRRETAARGVDMILTAYPYPWMVSIREALPYQVFGFDGVYDFRANRVHSELIGNFAEKLGIPYLSAYPVFENQQPGLYGDFDPHFNARGYARYAEFLTVAIGRRLTKKRRDEK